MSINDKIPFSHRHSGVTLFDTPQFIALLYTEKNIYLNLFGTKKICIKLKAIDIFFAIEENTFVLNAYFFVLKICALSQRRFFKLRLLFLLGSQLNTNYLSV